MNQEEAGEIKVIKEPAWVYVVSGLAGLLASIMVILVWLGYTWQMHKSAAKTLNLTGDFMSVQFEEIMKSNVQTLYNLKRRIEITGGDYFEYWAEDAKLILDQNPGFMFIEWIDSNMIIQDIEPLKGNEAAIGLDLNNIDYRKEGWIQASKDSLINVSNWAKLTQEGHAFLVDAPVFYHGKFQGTITAGIDFTGYFNFAMRGRDAYHIELYDEEGTLFFEHGDSSVEGVGNMYYENDIVIRPEKNQKWTFSIEPNDRLFETSVFLEKKVGLILGFMLALLLSVATFFILKTRRSNKREGIINKELRKLNKALEKAKETAEVGSKAKTEFLSNMSHEIRTPLNAILGLITIQKDKELDEEQKRKYLDMMEFSSKNLLALVNDIQDIDKAESGSMELHPVSFSTTSTLNKLLDLYEAGFEKKELKLVRTLHTDNVDNVYGDPIRFGQIITNLLRNAFKFTEIGQVEVMLQQQLVGDKIEVVLRVVDTGIGIPEESLPFIFDRFQQVDSGLMRMYEGSGLGLAITKKIVEKMGGSIRVESELGQGSTFEVQLMFDKGEPAEPAVSKHENTANHNMGKLLLCEDNPINALVLIKLLEDSNVSIDVAKNGKEGLEMVDASKYDLIFMDIQMPEMDGIEATKLIRKKGIKIPIIALSANVLSDAVNEALACGMQEYITKPYTRSDIENVLTKYLGATAI